MSDNLDLISVCVANYNGELIIEECIDSILNQDYKNIEIIVHDDCSSDRSVEILHLYGNRVHLMQSDSNVGFCVSNNRMAGRANGKYLLFFNNDAVLDENGITVLVNAMQKTSYGILTLLQKDYRTQKFIDSGRNLDLSLNPIPRSKEPQSIQDVMCVHGACLFISKELWHVLGGFPPAFSSVAEDLLLCLEVIAIGLKVGSVNTSFYLHRNGYSFGGGGIKNEGLVSSYKRRYLSERNRLFITYKLFPRILIPLIYVHLLTLIIEGSILSLVNMNKNILTKIYYKVIVDYFKFRNDYLRRNCRNQLPFKFVVKLKIIPYKLSLLIKYGIPKIR